MKTQIKTKLSPWLALGIFALISTSFAQEGSGVRGGGNTQDVNGTPRLLDLVTKAKCDDKSGNEIMASEKGIKPILDKLAKLDWYFAADLEKEIRQINFCYTGELKFLPPVDIDGAVIQRELPEYKSIRQLGVRNGYTVYVDQERLNLVPAFDRAMFFIHEATHTYLSMQDPTRKLDLYTIVAAIADAGTARVSTREKLHYIFSQHNLDFPLTVSELDPIRLQTEYATGSLEKRKEMILAQAEPEVLINTDLGYLNARVASWDVSNIPLKMRMASDIASILIEGTVAETARIMTEQKYTDVKVGETALSVLTLLTPEKQSIIFSSNSFVAIGNETYSWLASLTPVYSEFRIRANSDLQSLAASKPVENSVPLMSLNARQDRNNQEALPASLQALANITALLIKSEKWEQVKVLVTENENFYRGMALEAQIKMVDAMTPKFGAEKESSKKVLTMMGAGLKSRWIEILRGQLTVAQFKTFQSMLK